jgi:hypothetical protein
MRAPVLWFVPVLAVAAGAPGAARADDAQNPDALVGKLMPADGPAVLNFRGTSLHSITLRPTESAPIAEFDVDFDAHAAALPAKAREVIRSHRTDFAKAPNTLPRFVIGGGPEATRGDWEKRAEAVRDYIVKEFGVDAARIEIAGSVAAAQPAADSGGADRIHIAKYAQ